MDHKPIPRTTLGASIWHLMGWRWLAHGGLIPPSLLPFMGTAPSVDL